MPAAPYGLARSLSRTARGDDGFGSPATSGLLGVPRDLGHPAPGWVAVHHGRSLAE